jgi:N-acetylglucosaminyl-diphospho-decaprenol L-rhamnosyltransferase
VTFTIVIVLHDSAVPLQALLRSLAAHLPRRPQLVVVDTGSQDGGAELARNHGAEVIELRDNPGFGAANNAGVGLARHDVTVLLNPDCELLDDGLVRLASAAAGRDALWVPRLLDPDGSLQRSAHPLPGTVGALLPAVVHPAVLPRALRERVDPWRAGRPRPAGWAIAACLAARTSTLRRLGPFDPGQFLFYEDMDLCLRARAAGMPTLIDPSIRIRHLGGHSTGRAFGGEPHDLLARRRAAVVHASRGRTARALDDAAQALTFATRTLARVVLRRDHARERAQLRAVWRARKARGEQPS